MPCHFVQLFNKFSTTLDSQQICVDFQQLNATTKKDPYPFATNLCEFVWISSSIELLKIHTNSQLLVIFQYNDN